MSETTVQVFPGSLNIGSNLEVGSAGLFVNTLNGKIGIGTSEPSYILDLTGETANVGTLTSKSISSTAAISGQLTNSITTSPGSYMEIKTYDNTENVTINMSPTQVTSSATNNALVGLDANGGASVSGIYTTYIGQSESTHFDFNTQARLKTYVNGSVTNSFNRYDGLMYGLDSYSFSFPTYAQGRTVIVGAAQNRRSTGIECRTYKYGGLTVRSSGHLGYNITTDNDPGSWRWRFVDDTAKNPGNSYHVCYYPSGNYWYKGNRTSDRRLKVDIRDIDSEDALDKMVKLRPVHYNLIKPFVVSNQKTGFIAQEVSEIIPELVYHNHEEDDGKDEAKYGIDDEYEHRFRVGAGYAMDYDGITAFMVASIKKIKTQVENLKVRANNLKKI